MSCGFRKIMISGETGEYLLGCPWKGGERVWGSHRNLLGHSKGIDLHHWQLFCICFFKIITAVSGRPYIHKENQLDCSQGKRGLLSDIPGRSGRTLRGWKYENNRDKSLKSGTRKSDPCSWKSFKECAGSKTGWKWWIRVPESRRDFPKVTVPGNLSLYWSKQERRVKGEAYLYMTRGVCVCSNHSMLMPWKWYWQTNSI